MFHALATAKVDTEGILYEHILKDIQTLNEEAREGLHEVTALSVHAYAYVSDRYDLFTHGASIGLNYGPLVVARKKKSLEGIRTIAVPGKLTSAYLALKLRYPDFQEIVMPFDKIPDAVAKGQAEAGLLIHEGQLTYREKGLSLVEDLGKWWFDKTRLPLPMGVNAVRRDLPDELKRKISSHLKASIQYAIDHRQEALDHAMEYARELKRDVADEFVSMWVNGRTLYMGEEGKEAIRRLLSSGVAKGLVPGFHELVFID
jgi:1,4-dihydroxy-6-naphthoate synthase